VAAEPVQPPADNLTDEEVSAYAEEVRCRYPDEPPPWEAAEPASDEATGSTDEPTEALCANPLLVFDSAGGERTDRCTEPADHDGPHRWPAVESALHAEKSR
jgi:hypothetical protein